MKKSRKVIVLVSIIFLSQMLFSVSHAAAGIPFLMLSSTTYLAEEQMEITLLNSEAIKGEKYLEILWNDTGNIVLRTEMNSGRLNIPAPSKEGSYTVRVALEDNILTEDFQVNNSAPNVFRLQGEVVQSETGELIGPLLEWEEFVADEGYFVTRQETDGTSETYGPIYSAHWIDVNVQPNTTCTYRVFTDFFLSNTIILDFTELVPIEYIKNENKDNIVLTVDSPYMTVNGKSTRIDLENINTVPVMIKGRVMLPIRALVEEMGGVVRWDGKTRTVTLTAWKQEVKIPIDSSTIWVNGVSREFDVPAQIEGNRTLVPVRHLESLGCEVKWIEKTRSVIVYYNTGDDLY